MTLLIEALTLRLGYNATLVAIGAALLGFAAGAVGSFMILRKRALVSDAMAHATLPGVALAFIVAPLLRADATVAERRQDNLGEERDLQARHATLLASLRDLEEDRATDKLDADDYDRLKHELSVQAIEVM